MSEEDKVVSEPEPYNSSIDITSSFCYSKLKQYFTNENTSHVGSKRGRPDMNQIGESSLDLTTVESNSPPVDEIFKKSHNSQQSNVYPSSTIPSITSNRSLNMNMSTTTITEGGLSSSPSRSMCSKSPIIPGAWGWFVPADS